MVESQKKKKKKECWKITNNTSNNLITHHESQKKECWKNSLILDSDKNVEQYLTKNLKKKSVEREFPLLNQ
jgi:hypothetical protein